MLFDQPKIGESQYGKYYLYAVKNGDGSEYSFFAPEEVHKKIEGLKKGDAAVITKTAVQQGKKVVTSYDVEISTKDKTANAKSDNKYLQAMMDSFEDALVIQDKFNGMANVNQIAVTLFIQRTKSN